MMVSYSRQIFLSSLNYTLEPLVWYYACDYLENGNFFGLELFQLFFSKEKNKSILRRLRELKQLLKDVGGWHCVINKYNIIQARPDILAVCAYNNIDLKFEREDSDKTLPDVDPEIRRFILERSELVF